MQVTREGAGRGVVHRLDNRIDHKADVLLAVQSKCYLLLVREFVAPCYTRGWRVPPDAEFRGVGKGLKRGLAKNNPVEGNALPRALQEVEPKVEVGSRVVV